MQSGPPLTGASTHAVGAGHDYITIIYDCTGYVGDPDGSRTVRRGTVRRRDSSPYKMKKEKT